MSDYADMWVCIDCYFTHHYGAFRAAVFADGTSVLWEDDDPPKGAEIQWFAGDSDPPCDREPLGLVDDKFKVTDNTCSNHYYGQGGDWADIEEPCEHCGQTGDEDGLDTFSWRSCQGCGSTLGGSRYRLALWMKEDA